MAARMRRKASDKGHSTPNPSPVQKVPKVVNMIPTTNFSEFSGTFDSGTREKAPTRMTRRPARSAPRAAEAKIGRARLNSSHSQISYAVFCLKKKKTMPIWRRTGGELVLTQRHLI